MCQRRSVTSIALAVLLGIAAFPLVLVFAPVYFPWTLFVLAFFGGAVGVSVAPRGQRAGLLRALGLAVFMVAVVLAVMTVTSNMVLIPSILIARFSWIGWLLLPILVGVRVGEWLRARLGIARGAGVGAASVFAMAVVGAGLAFASAPPDVGAAPICDPDRFDCPRTQCAYMAERRRLLTIERVTAFDGVNITCTYTAWGGFDIGSATMGSRGGFWTDGAWPRFMSGRER